MLNHWLTCDQLNFLNIWLQISKHQIFCCALNALKWGQNMPTMTIISKLSGTYTKAVTKELRARISVLYSPVILTPVFSPLRGHVLLPQPREPGRPLHWLKCDQGQQVRGRSDDWFPLLRYDLMFCNPHLCPANDTCSGHFRLVTKPVRISAVVLGCGGVG